MAGNSENLWSGAFLTCSSSGDRQEICPVLPVSPPIRVRSGQFEIGSSSVMGNSSENRSMSGGFRDVSSLISWYNNLPHIGGAPENLSESGSFKIGISSSSPSDITQNPLRSSSFGIGSSSGSPISCTLENQFDLSGSRIASFSGHYTSGAPRNYFRLNGSGIDSSSGPYIGGSSFGFGASVIGSSSGPYINSASVGLSVSGTRHDKFFMPVGSENDSSLAYWNNYLASDDCEIYCRSGGIRLLPYQASQQNQINNFNMEASLENSIESSGFPGTPVTQQNSVLIISDTSENHFRLRGILHESSSVRRHDSRPCGGRPQTRSGLGRVGTGSSSPGRQITHSSRRHGTSGNHSWLDRVVSGSASDRTISCGRSFSRGEVTGV